MTAPDRIGPSFEEDPEAGPHAAERAPDEAYRMPCGGFWVFGYGSLMWRPGFDFIERRPATLAGYRRAFCLWSVRYRGTLEAPGLVLGLEAAADGAVRGVAFRVAAEAAEATRRYLAERELTTAAYREVAVRLACGDDACETTALAYVMDVSHRQYAGALSQEQKAQVIARRAGDMGANSEYLFNTLELLRAEGLAAEELARLEALAARVREIQEEDRRAAAGADPTPPAEKGAG